MQCRSGLSAAVLGSLYEVGQLGGSVLWYFAAEYISTGEIGTTSRTIVLAQDASAGNSNFQEESLHVLSGCLERLALMILVNAKCVGVRFVGCIRLCNHLVPRRFIIRWEIGIRWK